MALRGERLEYFTIAWNCLEGLIGVGAGILSGSISLVGFGIDSFIEVTSGAALLWRMSLDADEVRRERSEVLALRTVGVCFLGLAAYVSFEGLSSLVRHEASKRSFAGIALAVASLLVMPFLARAKHKVGWHLASAAMTADAKQTEFCAYLSAILLAGLLLNAGFGLWWADPAAALVMSPIIAKEGVDALRGKACCDHCG
ncbi:MAG: cation transporter [Candidatus Sulfotelmatobacter sp.]